MAKTAYITDRLVHDADSHVMEGPDWLLPFADPAIKPALEARLVKSYGGLTSPALESARELHADPAYRARDADEIMARKNFLATGATIKSDRPQALDLIGVHSQLVFPTSANVMLEGLEHGDDLELLYGTATASNRSLVDFCAVDRRLLAVGYVPLADTGRAADTAREAIAMGCKALLVPWACPRHHATSHIGLDRVWAQAQEAGLPILFHVGVADKVLPPAHKNNGLPEVPDFHGGEENFRSISYMAIPAGPQQALSMLILDGVLDRFPKLMIGVIELGAVWVPGFMRQLDSAFEAFGRHEERLQGLALKPSEYITRQVRATPYPTEPTGWIIEQAGPEICMFSSDYPHVEGGRNPYGRFERATAGLPEPVLDQFFAGNFEALMGEGLEAALRAPR